MMGKFRIIIILFITLFLINNCTELKDWSDPLDNIPPGMISNPKVENISGGAIITYTLPDDKDLLGVKALYSYNDDNKKKLEVFSSAYTDTIKLVGFPNTDERTVQLIAIDKSENESQPLSVKIKPLTPPVDIIRQTLNVETTFGGIFVTWLNTNQTEIGVELFVKDSTDAYVHDYTYFTREKDGKYSFRGFGSIPREFRIQIRDRWDNYAEQFDTIVTPLFEQKIAGMDKYGVPIFTRYGWANGEAKWRGDLLNQNKTKLFEFMFDGITSVHEDENYWNSSGTNALSDYTDNPDDKNTVLIPMYFIIDLGNSVKLSRHHLWHRGRRIFSDNAIRKYEIWASNEKPKGPSDFDSYEESLSYWTSWPEVNGTDQWKENWVKIADCETIPPSGATNVLEVTGEDMEWGKANGFEFEIYSEFTSKSFRYLRIVSQPNWSGACRLHVGEMEFFGAYDN